MKARIGRLHVITDTTLQSRYTHAALAALAIAGGADTIQYRSKGTAMAQLIDEAAAVAEVCRRHGVTFLVNDRVDLCLAVDADGVHLGRDDMPLAVARKILGPEKIIGGTVRGVADLKKATEASADYVGLGPIFGTTSKSLTLGPLGLDIVREVARSARIPVIGIAGITAENAASVVAAGAHGVAVIGAVCCAPDVEAAAGRLAAELKMKNEK